MNKIHAQLAGIVGVAMLATAGLGEGFSAGVRYWQADWEIQQSGDSQSFGDGPMFLGYLGYHDAEFSLIGQFGAGSGWENGDVDVDRTDLSLALTQTRNNLTYGIGVRRMAYEADDANAEWNYTGPELLLGAQMPFADSGWSASLTGSLGLYWWDFEREDFSDDGSTSGFTVDGGFAYLVEAVTLRAGYRIQNVSEDGDFAGDEFKGPYLDLGWMW